MMNFFRRKQAPEAPHETPPPHDSAPVYEAWAPDTPSEAPPAEAAQPAAAEPAPAERATEPAPIERPTEPPPGTPIAVPNGMVPDHPLTQPIARALSSVYDPEIPVNIYELGLIYGVTVNEQNDAHIEMTLTTPACPVAGQMPGMVEYAVASQVEGIGDVEVEIVWDPPWTPDMMSEAAQLELGFM